MRVAERRDHAALGVVYTPADVARAMVELALAPLVDGKGAEDILALRICDPAIGEGAFLVEIVEALAARLAMLGTPLAAARRLVATRCVYGVDVDARAVATARARLGAGDTLRVGDALALDWSAEFPPFDLVIGNPPYIRQELLADKVHLRTYASYDGVADLYVYFLELAHRIACAGGRYCFITPAKWLTVAYARPLRRFLAAQASVEGVIDLGRAPLFDADAFPCIVWGTVGEPQRTPIRAARALHLASLPTAGAPHDRARWTAEPWHIDDPHDRALLDELERRWPTLGELVGKPARGVVTGLNSVFVIDRATRDRLVAADPACAEIVRPFIKGRDVRPYQAAPVERFIVLVERGTDITRYPAIAAYLAEHRAALAPKPHRGAAHGRKPGSYQWYQLQDPVGELAASRAPRLFYQDIQTAPACCLDETGLVPDTTVWILPTADRYLLAVLNSPLYGWYARRRFPPALNGAVRPKHEYIRALPIATPTPALRARIEELVEARLAGTPCDDAIAAAVLEAYEIDQLTGR